MKKISIPILFFLTIIFQIISCYLFLGNKVKVSYLFISVIPSITATFLSYASLYYITVYKSKEEINSDIKVGFTIYYFLIIFTFMLLLFLLVDNKLYSNAIFSNAIILTIYGRQILNKEIKKLNL